MPRKPSEGNFGKLPAEAWIDPVTIKWKMGEPRRTKIRPGIMVSLRPRNRGGVSYVRTELGEQTGSVSGQLVQEWQTRKVVENPEETDRAKKTIGKAASLVRAVCVRDGTVNVEVHRADERVFTVVGGRRFRSSRKVG